MTYDSVELRFVEQKRTFPFIPLLLLSHPFMSNTTGEKDDDWGGCCECPVGNGLDGG